VFVAAGSPPGAGPPIQFLYLVDAHHWHSVAGIALPPVYANYLFH
jgi:hypothetical protein